MNIVPVQRFDIAASMISTLPGWSMLISGVPLISSEYVAVRVIDHTQAGFAEYDNVTSGTAANVIFANGLNIEAQKATRVT